MNFKEIKKVIFSHTPFPELPEEDKKIANNTVFMGLVFVFLFMAIVGYIAQPSGFFHNSSDKVEKLVFLLRSPTFLSVYMMRSR